MLGMDTDTSIGNGASLVLTLPLAQQLLNYQVASPAILCCFVELSL